MVVFDFEVQVLTRPSHQERESGPDPTEEIQFYKLVWVTIHATYACRDKGPETRGPTSLLLCLFHVVNKVSAPPSGEMNK